jgi:hypothetical protein
MCQIMDILDYHILPIMTQVLTGKFLLLLLYLDSTAVQSSIPFRYLLYLLVRGHKGPFYLFSVVCVAKEYDGTRAKGS